MNKRQLVMMMCVLVVALLPEVTMALNLNAPASGDHIANALEKILDIMTGKLAKVLAIISVVGCGYMAFLGHLGWKVVVNVASGIAIIFGATSIANLLIG